jgi:serine acetyltransferase
VRIGANCVVTTDIPDNATVVLERPRIIIKDTPQDNRFISQAQLQRLA